MNRTTRLAIPVLFAVSVASCASQRSAPPAAASPAAEPAASAPSRAGSQYHVIRKIPLGGEGGWDYLTSDSDARRLYVSRGTRVVVLDLDSGETLGEIPNTQGVHGVAVVPELHRGFTSNGRSSTVTVFDTKTRAVLGEVKTTGENPDAILYDPASRRVFTFNGRGKNATAIDAESQAVAGTVDLGGKPETGVSDGKGRVLVNIEDTNEVVVIDSKGLKALARWSLAPCEEPTGMAFDAAHRRLFIGCHNKKMMVLDSENGHVVATLPIGEGVDANAFDAKSALAFASCGDGTLAVVHEDSPDSFRVVENVSTQRGARTMALDEKTHRIFLATAEFGPPPPATPDRPNPRPSVVPGSFTILVVGR
jgi:DNA-binding beta-propeller fold protein YncE